MSEQGKIEQIENFGFVVSGETDVVKSNRETHEDEVNKKNREIVKLQERVSTLRNLILPILNKLKDSDDGTDKTAYIHWPKRKKIIEDQIDKIMKV